MTGPLDAVTAVEPDWEERCPSCGSDPDDDTIHRDGCERIGTCGQMGPPWLDRPWHLDPAGPFDAQASHAHRAEVHRSVGEGPF